ncbi:MAG TPA: DUF481 domain-containing protein [Gemmatimonadaceae bacterium]|nr:DUF481 domain-containing protein [Gemmatimonadaceae bacterium]
MIRHCTSIVAAAVALSAWSRASLAQAPAPAADSGWSAQLSLNGSLFFGNTKQTTVATGMGLAHADSTIELNAAGRFAYGEADLQDEGTTVTKRSWLGSLSADYHPLAVVSPFVLATVESSFEKRVDLRVSAGMGAKYTFLKDDGTKLDASVTLLAERTTFPDSALASTLARWSARFRASHTLNDRVSMSHETFYRPELDAIGRFTLTSTTSIAFQLVSALHLDVSFVDNYDSEATSRGARTNNDGQLVAGVLATF